MSAWPRFLQRLWRRYQVVEELSALPELAVDQVEIGGRVEVENALREPLGGRACIAIDYRAWPPSTTIGMDGATAHNSRAFQLNAHQAVDFVLVADGVRVLVQPETGEDVTELHQRLLERYGVGLRAEVDIVEEGRELRVAGRVTFRRSAGRSPHRTEPYAAVIRAERFWLT